MIYWVCRLGGLVLTFGSLNKKKPKVVIIQAHVPHYRVAFYEELRKRCDRRGVLLEVVYSPKCSIAAVPGSLAWGEEVAGKKLGPIILQRIPSWAWSADLVIIPQEVKFLVNIVLFLGRKLTRKKTAIWGHGRDFQSPDSKSLKARLRDYLSRRADWWFAYNDKSVEAVEALGFDPNKITEVRNSIDVKRITDLKSRVTRAQLARLKDSLSIDSDNIAIFTGRFNKVKRTRFLLEVCEKARELVDDFHVILIGKGPQQDLVDEVTSRCHWIHAVGAKDDAENIPYWMLSKVLLMPGGVGLVVLDSFVFGVPMVVVPGVRHGPEISYFEVGVHGIEVSGNTPEAYARSLADIMKNPDQIAKMRQNCLEKASEFSIEAMANNFETGIVQCLS